MRIDLPFTTAYDNLKTVAQSLNYPMNGNRLEVDHDGMLINMHTFAFNPHFSMSIWEARFNEDLHVPRVPTLKNEGFQLSFFLESNLNHSIIWTDGKQKRYYGFGHAYFQSSMLTGEIIYPKDVHFRVLTLYFDRTWICHLLDRIESPIPETVLQLCQNDTPLLFSQEIDREERSILNRIWSSQRPNFIQELSYESWAFLLLTRSIGKIAQRDEVNMLESVRIEDLKRIRQIRDALIADLSQAPPSIPELSKKFGISDSKLKKIFKQVYGKSIYGYHQQKRLEHARDLLESGEKTVSEAGYTIGYTNLSKFSRAFKAHFGFLPSRTKDFL